MRENLISKGSHWGQLAFMAAVTAYLLGAVFVHAARGSSGLTGMVIFAFAAGFGLEFVSAAWTGRLRGRRQRSHMDA